MISVSEALALIEEKIILLDSMELALSKSLNYVLAENVYSKIDMPPFNQSAMDGYAVCQHQSNTYSLIGEIQAGDNYSTALKPGEAIRIFTGASVPVGTSFVAQQELVSRLDGNNIELQKPFNENQNIRLKAEQIKEGELALEKGSVLNPSAIGFLATLGIEKVIVFKKPSIGILVTGNELVSPDKNLLPGQIYESNSIMLKNALHSHDFEDISMLRCSDSIQEIESAIEKLLSHDVVLISGGISVGDYDFVKPCLEKKSVQEIFYKVRQRPGKPFYFGVKNQKLIFALPGNPASTLTCFYIYVLPALNKLIGKSFNGLNKFQFKLKNNYDKTVSLGLFLKAFYQNDTVQILANQSSAMLNSFAAANCLIYLPEELTTIKDGELVDAFLIS